MEYNVTKHDTSADVQLIYSLNDIEEAYEKAYLKASKKVKINGFRPGKAPLPMVKKVLGESVAEDAINIMLSDSINDLYPKLEFKPFREPKIEIEKFERQETLVAKAIFELPPQVTLKNYKKLPLDVFEFEVLEEDIKDQLEKIQFQLSKTQQKEEGEVVESKDLLDINIRGLNEEGEEIQNANNHRYYLGLNLENEDLDKHFHGMKAGEEKEFPYEYPADYSNKDLAGKKLKYSVKVNEIFKVILPELDDAMAKEWNEKFSNLDELKSHLKEELDTSYRRGLEQKYFDKSVNLIMESSDYKIPASLVKDEMDHIFHKTLHDFRMDHHMSMEEFANIVKVDLSELQKNFEDRALVNLKVYLTIHEIAKLEEIKVSEDELSAEFTKYRENSGETNFNQGDIERILKNIHENILVDKIMKFLFENSEKKIESGLSLSRIKEILNTK
ncbi:MAG: trigger factor [Leptospiraceae bacterium]|nr:trigger factor [Leptospiraceae bacterium]MCP5510643.1 trigger factor [Leptospiraceae bacterium]